MPEHNHIQLIIPYQHSACDSILIQIWSQSWHLNNLYLHVFATVSTPAACEEKTSNSLHFTGQPSYDWQHFSAFFWGHTSRLGKRQKDEHIIPRTSLLTMPIYFDNQLTIVPVQPLKGQWFIRIDQFWVTSCAALWGQTEAWLAVQSGMLSNAQAWLTAHQHAELNSLAKGFPFIPSHTHIKLWMLPCIEIKLRTFS